MPSQNTIRVAAVQLAAGTDIDANLATCLRLLDQAGELQPDLVVLPEFCNHLSWYDDQDHCYAVSATLDGEFLSAIGDKAKAINAWVVINVTLRREGNNCSGTSVLFSPQGERVASNDKQVLIGHENQFLQRPQQAGPVVDTPLGKLGLYACMDGVIFETPRCLALRGAQILCNSVNSFAPDEGSLHIPVRAAENRVFVVAANKVGPLIPEHLLDPVSEATGIAKSFLYGAGDSQIVAPDGTVLALAGKEEEIIWADIDPSEALNKQQEDGLDIFAARRSDLYQPIGSDPALAPVPSIEAPTTAKAAMVQLAKQGPEAIDEARQLVAEAAAQGADLIVLPELFCFTAAERADITAVATRAEQAIAKLASAAGNSHVVTSLPRPAPDGLYHSAVVISQAGLVAEQPQLHRCNYLPWAQPGDQLHTVNLPVGRLGLVTGDDIIFPEVFRLIAMQGAAVVAVPFSARQQWLMTTGLIERSAENRLCMVAVTQPSEFGNSFATRLETDFTVMTPWESRPFDGILTYPLLTHSPATPGITMAELTPANAANKIVSAGTDLVSGRPWWLVQAITD